MAAEVFGGGEAGKLASVDGAVVGQAAGAVGGSVGAVGGQRDDCDPRQMLERQGGGEGELLVAAALTGIVSEADGGFAAEDEAGGRGYGQTAVLHFTAETDENFGDFGGLAFDVCREQDRVVAQLGCLCEGGAGGGAVVSDDEGFAGGEDRIVRFGGVGDVAGQPGLQAVEDDLGQGAGQAVFFDDGPGVGPGAYVGGRWARWRSRRVGCR